MNIFTRFYVVVLFTLAISIAGDAQVYFGVDGGYGFPMGKQMIASDIMATPSGMSFSEFQGSFGGGMTAGLFTGYKFTKHIAGEIGFENLSGSKITSSFADTTLPGYVVTIDRIAKAKMPHLIPTIRFSIGENKFNAFMRTGLLIGIGGEITSDRNQTGTASWFGTQLTEQTEVFRGGIAWGFLGGVGVNYSANSKLNFFAETTLRAENWAPLKSTITKYTIAGIDQLPGMSVSQKEFEYNRNVVPESPAIQKDKPTARFIYHYPFSSFGFMIGASYSFGEVKTKTTE